VEVLSGFTAYYQAYNGVNVLVTFILLNGNAWATYRGSMYDLPNYWQIRVGNLVASSTGFSFSANSFYCIYISILI
jgi:hypothetical protein